MLTKRPLQDERDKQLVDTLCIDGSTSITTSLISSPVISWKLDEEEKHEIIFNQDYDFSNKYEWV